MYIFIWSFGDDNPSDDNPGDDDDTHRDNPGLIQCYPDFHSVPKLFEADPVMKYLFI